MGAYQTGSCSWSSDGGLPCGWLWPWWPESSVPWYGASCLPILELSLCHGSLSLWAVSPFSVEFPQRWLFPCLRSQCLAMTLYLIACACGYLFVSVFICGGVGFFLFSVSARHLVLLLCMKKLLRIMLHFSSSLFFPFYSILNQMHTFGLKPCELWLHPDWHHE